MQKVEIFKFGGRECLLTSEISDVVFLFKMFEVRGTELNFLFLVRSADPADRWLGVPDGRTDSKTHTLIDM